MPGFVRILRLAMFMAAVASPAMAQLILDPKLQDPSRVVKPPRPTNFTARAVAPWPRLDPGSVLCPSRGDLAAYARVVQARLDGTPAPTAPTGCRVLGGTTAIDVLTRAAPAATEVRLKESGETGWTDTWLPQTPPR